MTGEEYLASFGFKEDETPLVHYGVKGMKWGVRRTPAQLGHRTSLVRKVKKARMQARIKKYNKEKERAEEKKSAPNSKLKSTRRLSQSATKKQLQKKAKAMTNQELQEVINRINLERKYVELNTPAKTRGEKFFDASKKIVTTAISAAAQEQATKTAKSMMQKIMDEVNESDKKDNKKK